MPRPSRPWFRFYVEAVHDRKMRRLTPAQRWLWVAILAAARQSPVTGELFVAEGVPMTYVELADYAGVRVREVAAALVQMETLGMVSVNGSEAIAVTNWNARQFESDDVTARTAKHRSKERSNVVPGNAPDTETDTETERERPRKRGARLPDEWEPSEATKAWVREKYPQHARLRVLEHFRDYWHSATGPTSRKLDWDLAFKNWVRKQDDFTPQRTGPVR